MNSARMRILKKGKTLQGPIVYWMSREQRYSDNWAMIFAAQQAKEQHVPLIVVFTLVKNYLNAIDRHYNFMLSGLIETEKELRNANIPFIILIGNPPDELSLFLIQQKVSMLVTDFDPLKTKRKWKNELIDKIEISIIEVDAHNIVPCWHSSQKQEFGAYTIRPKILKLLPEFLDEFPKKPEFKTSNLKGFDVINWDVIKNTFNYKEKIVPINWLKPGIISAQQTLDNFIDHKLQLFNTLRNNPNHEALSNLSPYLHYGQISAQRVALNILKAAGPKHDTDAFLEELIVRRELSDNFCFYNSNYDNIQGFPQWALKSLQKHMSDEREYKYTLKQFELAQTHDELWNAAQKEMMVKGKMHGYMRMYWAKKILEWSSTPNTAVSIAIYLNDKYSLDGRDPNGYAGIAWAIGGLHDRAWKEREVYGMIRYMNYNGCARKFDVKKYILSISELCEQAENL